MWRKSITNISIIDFEETIGSHHVIILYPQTSYSTLFLSYLLENVSGQFLYYRLKATDQSIQQMLTGLIQELNANGQAFGNKTQKALKSDNLDKIAQAFAADLENYDDEALLYLDELDRLDLSDDYRNFFATVIQNLKKQTKLVINSRQLTLEPWQQAIADGHAVVIGTERRQSQLMFSMDERDKPQLEIYAFGRGEAIINGLSVDSWDGALPRQLFFYFIDKDLITRNEIFETFWSSLNVKEATNVFHVTKRKISERLSLNVLDDENYELTTYYNGFYRPADKIARHYDVAEFETAIDEASMTFDDDEQAKLYRRALNLYRAPFLTGIDMPWVYDRREKLQRKLLEALIGLARLNKSAQQLDESLGYFMCAIHEKPLREDLHREVMLLYLALGHPSDALKQYQQLEALLQDMLGVGVGPETQALRDKIQS